MSMRFNRFNPSREVYDKDNARLFGFIVRRQGPKLLMVIEIYNESKRDEIISNTKIMATIAENIMKKQRIDRVCVVDIKDVNQQLAKHNIDHKKLDIERMQCYYRGRRLRKGRICLFYDGCNACR